MVAATPSELPAGRPPWADLPRDLTRAMRPHLGEVTAAVIAALPQEVPRYARPLEGQFGEGLRRGVGVALGRFLDLPGTAEPALSQADRAVYVALGRGELRQGREMETLLAAYRVGARVAFRQFARLAQLDGVGSDDLVLLAEAVFAYIDELSAASVEGYAQEQSRQAGESGRRRSALLGLLLQPVVDLPACREAARRAAWPLPDRVVAVVVPQPQADGLAQVVGSDALLGEAGEHGPDVVVLVRAEPGWRTGLDRRLAGRQAAVGPPRDCSAAALSLRLARLMAQTIATGPAPRHVPDHLADLLVAGLPEVADALAQERLAPLEALPAATGERLAQTLLAWLRHRGERQKVAAELHVHTQTVGYRLGQLRELLGTALEDPQGRFELELALRYRALVAGELPSGASAAMI